MPEYTRPTAGAAGLEHVRLAPHPELPHVTVLSVFQGHLVDGQDVASANALLSADERRRLAHDLDPDRPPTQWAYDRACAALEKHRQLANAAEAEVQRLEALLEPARYVQGPAGCSDPEDRNCPEYIDEHGNNRDDVDWCSHVEHRVATFADVHARERLEWMVLDVHRMATEGTLPPPAELAEDIRGQLDALRHELEELDGQAAFSVADIRATTEELEQARQRWNEREGAEFARTCAEQAFKAREEITRLTVLLRQRDAEIAHLRTEHAR